MDETTIEFEPYVKLGLKLLRRTNDPNSLKEMYKHYNEAIQKQYGMDRQPRNVAKDLVLPPALALLANKQRFRTTQVKNYCLLN